MPARAALAGALGVGAALAAGELLAGLVAPIPSPIAAVAQQAIPYTPAAVEDWAITTFGTADKLVLEVGATAVTLILGAITGTVARGRFWIAVIVFVAFGSLGAAAGTAQPESVTWLTVAANAIVVLVGLSTMRRVLARRVPADATAASPTDPPVDRRSFLRLSAGVGAAAVVGAAVGRLALAPRTARIDTAAIALPSPARALGAVPSGADLGVDGLSPIHTPNDRFYRIDTALMVPRVDPDDWSLRITGLVESELELTYDDLLAERLIEVDVTLACVSNEVGGELIGNARWLGVRLDELLRRAGVRDGAGQVVGRAVDGWTAGFPLRAALDGRDALVAVGMNGEALPARHGFPARLVVPGLFGYVSATKWLSEIELTTWDGYDAYWVPRGWSKEAPIKTGSRIDVPRRDAEVPAGDVVVAGVAWAPRQGVAAVEVEVDGDGWRGAELSRPLSADTWLQWRLPVELPPGEHRLRVRAVDGDGVTQPEGPTPPRPDGAEGWHPVTVRAV